MRREVERPPVGVGQAGAGEGGGEKVADGAAADPAVLGGPPALEEDNPVARTRRSAAAQAKASHQHDPAGQPYRSFRGMLEHLATRTATPS